MYKLKQQPSDFIVKEISNLKIKNSGRYIYFLLHKTNRNTLDVVKELAKRLRLKEKQIGFAGTKDKQAVTEQVISVLGVSQEKVLSVKIENVELSFLGHNDKPISLGDLDGNEFEIIIRDLDKYTIKKSTFLENYFDEQRFSKNNKRIGKHLLKKEFKEAIKLIADQKLNNYLLKYNHDFIGALRLLPSRLLRLYLNAYQSYLWNETLAEFLKDNGTIEREVEYSLGKLVFVKDEIKNLQIPLIGYDEDLIIDQKMKSIISKIMEKEKISHADFIIRQIPELSLEGEFRSAFIEIKDLKVGKEEKDELNKGKKKLFISFSLGKGSYATMVVKKIINIHQDQKI